MGVTGHSTATPTHVKDLDDPEDVTSERPVFKDEQKVPETMATAVSGEEKAGTQDTWDQSHQTLTSPTVAPSDEDDGPEMDSEAQDGILGNDSNPEPHDNITSSSSTTAPNQSESVEAGSESSSSASNEVEEIVTFEEFKTKMSVETANKQALSGH